MNIGCSNGLILLMATCVLEAKWIADIFIRLLPICPVLNLYIHYHSICSFSNDIMHCIIVRNVEWDRFHRDSFGHCIMLGCVVVVSLRRVWYSTVWFGGDESETKSQRSLEMSIAPRKVPRLLIIDRNSLTCFVCWRGWMIDNGEQRENECTVMVCCRCERVSR